MSYISGSYYWVFENLNPQKTKNIVSNICNELDRSFRMITDSGNVINATRGVKHLGDQAHKLYSLAQHYPELVPIYSKLRAVAIKLNVSLCDALNLYSSETTIEKQAIISKKTYVAFNKSITDAKREVLGIKQELSNFAPKPFPRNLKGKKVRATKTKSATSKTKGGAAKKIRAAKKPSGGAKWAGKQIGEEGVEGLGKAWRAVRKFGQEVFEFVIKRAH